MLQRISCMKYQLFIVHATLKINLFGTLNTYTYVTLEQHFFEYCKGWLVTCMSLDMHYYQHYPWFMI